MLPKLHAEINCTNSIRHLDINFSKVKLYIYRIRKDQSFGLSRPCHSCMAAIKDLGIKDIYYTTNNGYAYKRIEQIEKYDIGGVAYFFKFVEWILDIPDVLIIHTEKRLTTVILVIMKFMMVKNILKI